MSTRRFKLFSSIYIFRQLIMNIYCNKIIENKDNSEDEYISDFQKIIKLQFVQQISCEILMAE